MENRKPRKLEEDPEFTLEEAEKWLSKVEDDAWATESRAGSLEVLLINMLIGLAEKNVLDGERLIQRLERALPLLNSPHRIGVEALLTQLRSLLSGEAPDVYVLH